MAFRKSDPGSEEGPLKDYACADAIVRPQHIVLPNSSNLTGGGNRHSMKAKKTDIRGPGGICTTYVTEDWFFFTHIRTCRLAAGPSADRGLTRCVRCSHRSVFGCDIRGRDVQQATTVATELHTYMLPNRASVSYNFVTAFSMRDAIHVLTALKCIPCGEDPQGRFQI